MADDIQNYLPTVMFRGTLCSLKYKRRLRLIHQFSGHL